MVKSDMCKPKSVSLYHYTTKINNAPPPPPFMQKENKSFVFGSGCQMRSLQGKTALMKDEDPRSLYNAIVLSVFSKDQYKVS